MIDPILIFLFSGMILCCLCMLYCTIRIFMIDRELDKLCEQESKIRCLIKRKGKGK